MSVADETSQASAPLCWCCGNQFEEQDLVRLGSHPEVGVCSGCARFLHRLPLLGPLLHRLDHHLP
ncbi:hypothetical protein OHA10_14945 [Kribbella sp. NBC_00662]|uniref:hypothetical protein n=1 Tax=Kribbella sp. NBC_00662 TaxID=2975969 RepID=UPI0032475E86